MFSNDQQYVLNLLRESLGEPSEYIEPENIKYIAEVICRSGIVLTVYRTIKSRGKEAEELEKAISIYYFATLKQIANQIKEGDRILMALNQAGLDCIALKGWEIQSLYPQKYMRQMADIDILVRPYKFDKIKYLMEELGFSTEGETPWMHDNFIKDVITVEMHKRLTDDSGLLRVWEKEMWTRATSATGHVFKMSKEDYYIFHFVHLHKDFIHGSLGLRRIVDTWLLQRQPVDMTAVKRELEKFGIWTFHERMVHLSRVVMGEEDPDDNARFLLNHAFTHGIYGSSKSIKVGQITSTGKGVIGGKLKVKLEGIFFPYKWMKLQYPILEKWPILLPYCWIKRIFRYLWRRKKTGRKSLDFGGLSAEDYKEMREFYEAGGV